MALATDLPSGAMKGLPRQSLSMVLYPTRNCSNVALPFDKGMESLVLGELPNFGNENFITPFSIACKHYTELGYTTVEEIVFKACAMCVKPLKPQYPTATLVSIRQFCMVSGENEGI